ncbi:hypothetical protein THIOSC15_2800001 [uncultured Thiomicrorhabdus sp.]
MSPNWSVAENSTWGVSVVVMQRCNQWNYCSSNFLQAEASLAGGHKKTPHPSLVWGV